MIVEGLMERLAAAQALMQTVYGPQENTPEIITLLEVAWANVTAARPPIRSCFADRPVGTALRHHPRLRDERSSSSANRTPR